MKILAIRCLVVAIVLCAVSVAAFGSVPRILTVQGKLTDSQGQPVPDGVQSVTFRLYDVETCGQGTVLWQEVQNVQTNGGIFNVNLGAVTPITLSFDAQYWLGMQPAISGELCPRTRLTKAPYAVSAETVEDGAITTAKIADGAVMSNKIGATWTDWTPTYGANGSMTYTSVVTSLARYLRLGKIVFFHLKATGVTGGVASDAVSFTLPVPAAQSADTSIVLSAWTHDPLGDPVDAFSGAANKTGTVIYVHRHSDGGIKWLLGANRMIVVSGFYESQ